MTIARRMVVSGVVQGVGFRWATRHEAARLGLGGWVRNRADGAVEAWVEGEGDAVAAMLTWAETGPPGSTVARLDVADAVPWGFEGFEIRA